MKELTQQVRHGHLELILGKTIHESFEHKVNRVLNAARDSAGECTLQSLDEFNNLKQMVTAGSKGSVLNISQVSPFFLY